MRALWAALLFAASLILLPATVSADRFGPPWMARVAADQTAVHTEDNADSPNVGALGHGAIVVVLDQRGDWTRVQDGWVWSADIAETSEPWIAQANDSVSVYAKPNAGDVIRRSASGTDLLLVTGVSHGVDGDNSVWWATTEGYVALNSIHGAPAELFKDWHLPSASDAPQGWWATVKSANVRAAPSADASKLGEFSGSEHVKVLGAVGGSEVNGDTTWYRIDGGRYPGGFVHASLVDRMDVPAPTVAPPPADRQLGDKPWLVVDRATHTLTLLRNGSPVFSTYVALGKAGRDTLEGGYTTYLKYSADRMTSSSVPDAERSYDLPNVPFVQYFKDDGSGIHGTYWHDLFGSDESQGCINVTWSDSAYLFQFTTPTLAEGHFREVAPPEESTPLVILH